MEFEVEEVARTTFTGKAGKTPIFVATLKSSKYGVIKIKENNQSSFRVDEVWELTKSEEVE